MSEEEEQEEVKKSTPIRSLNKLCDEIKIVLRSDRDFLMCISGKTGEGKSTLAQQIAYRVDPKFNIHKQTVFTREEFVDLIKDEENIPMYSAIIADEAINMLFKRDFMRAGQKMLLRLLDMCRSRCLLLILCLPNVWSLDKHVLDSRLRTWLYVEERGTSYCFIPDTSPFCDDPWHRQKNEKKLKYWALGAIPTRSPNYLANVHFSDLDPIRKKEYLAVKKRKKEGAEYEISVSEARLKKKLTEETALDVIGQLYDAGKLKKKDLKELAPSLAKNFHGLMIRINRRRN